MKRLALLAFILPAVSGFALHGYLQIGYGVKAKGMAGIAIAYPQDAFVAAANPAGISRLGCRFDTGVHWFRNQGAVRIYDASPERELQARLKSKGTLWWPEAAATLHFGCGQTVGLAAYVAGEWDLHYDRGLEESEASLRSKFRTIVVTPSWSWSFASGQAVGLAINIGFSSLKLGGLQLFEGQSLAPALVTDNGVNWATGISVRFGWLGRYRCVQAGVVYQTKTYNSLFRRYRGFVPEGNIDLPSQFGVGGAWWILPCLVLSMEATKVFWTDGRWFKNDPVGDEGAPFGAINGPGLGWRDQLIARLGAAWHATGSVTVRVGMSHGNTPVGRGDTFLNILTLETIEEHLTLGLTWAFGCHEFSIDYVYGIHHVAAGFNENPEPLSYTELSQHQHSIGLAYGMRF